ncbi:MAG: hypothetical protein MZU95_00805 [Desulfomicrobium escambiense]|nr:hypothetical protein [Desulfomicrobium escambiense]
MLDLNDTVAGMLKMLRRLIGEDIDLAWQPGGGPVAGQDGPVPDRPDPGQPVRQRPRRHRRRGQGHHRDATTPPSTRPTAPTTPGFVPASTCMLAVSDNGCGMDQEMHGAALRAVLHHQGDGQGHRAGPGHGLRHRQAERRLHQRLQRAGPGHDLQDLPAPPRGRAPQPQAEAPAGSAQSRGTRRCCWWRTSRRS